MLNQTFPLFWTRGPWVPLSHGCPPPPPPASESSDIVCLNYSSVLWQFRANSRERQTPAYCTRIHGRFPLVSRLSRDWRHGYLLTRLSEPIIDSPHGMASSGNVHLEIGWLWQNLLFLHAMTRSMINGDTASINNIVTVACGACALLTLIT